jgi:hypothetical protein
MLQDSFNPAKSLNHVSSVVVEIPQLSIMFLMGPPERILLEKLVLFELLPDSPTLIIGKSEPIFLEESIDSRNTMIPGLFQIIQSESSVLSLGLLSLDCILGPDSLTVNKLGVPSLNVSIQVGNKLILFVGHACSEMRNSLFSLFRVSQVSLRNEDVPHRQHTQTSQLLGCIEDNRRESAGHFGVEADLDSCLDLVLGLHQEIQHFISMNDGLPKVSHKSNERRVPLVCDFCECC